MANDSVSKSYACALLDLSKKVNVNIVNEFVKLNEALNSSNELDQFLFLDVFTVEEKIIVLKEICKRLEISEIFQNFLFYLTEEKRIGLLDSIYKDVVVIDDDNKGFLRGVIEGNENQISEEYKNKLIAFLKDKLGKKIDLEYINNEKITAGYKVTVGDLQLDASLDNQLAKLKSTILNV